MWISWGPGEDGTSTIEAWEPNRRLRVALSPPAAGGVPLDAPIVDEYTIERRGDATVLRLVMSGIPDVAAWDGFYDGTNVGWPSFFRTLRHYLERHRGERRHVIKVVGKLPGTLDEAWTRVTGTSGFAVDAVAGSPFTSSAYASPLHGRVVFAQSPTALELTIDELGDAFFAQSTMGGHGAQFVYAALSVYGKTDAEAASIRERWVPWLSGVLGMAASAVP
jgi:hypothetical protein